MTASNGQHRSLSAATAALKYEYVFLGFCQQASMSDATHWDLTKKTRARSSGISHQCSLCKLRWSLITQQQPSQARDVAAAERHLNCP